MAEDRAYAFLGRYQYNDSFNENGLPGTGTGTSSDRRWYARARFFRKVRRIRDELRAALDPAGTHLKWLVTEITTWVAIASNQSGIGFIVRHNDGAGAATGPEWLFVFYYREYDSGNSNSINVAIGNNTEATLGDKFFQTNSMGITAFGTQGGIAVHYNSRSGLDSTGAANDRYQMGFVSFVNGTYDWHSVAVEPGGAGTFTLNESITIATDTPGTTTGTFKFEKFGRIYFTAPGATNFAANGAITDTATGLKTRTMSATIDKSTGDYMPIDSTSGGINPYSNLPGFMNTNSKLRGIVFDGCFAVANLWTYWSVVFDWTEPFLAIYATHGLSNNIRNIGLLGKIITQKTAGHTQSKDCTYALSLTVDSDEAGTIAASRIEAFHDQPSTNREVWNQTFRTDFSMFSEPRALDNKAEWDIVEIWRSNETKGRLKENVVRVIGASNEHYMRVWSDANATFVKLTKELAFPWKTGTPRFPPIPWGALANTGNVNTLAGEILADRDI